MKKDYVKPEMLVEEVLLEGMLAASLGEGGADEELGAPSRREGRGSWGDLWN